MGPDLRGWREAGAPSPFSPPCRLGLRHPTCPQRSSLPHRKARPFSSHPRPTSSPWPHQWRWASVSIPGRLAGGNPQEVSDDRTSPWQPPALR